jgi:hypothetical protein
MSRSSLTPSPLIALPMLLVGIFTPLALSACSAPVEFPDWSVPVPEGTRIIEYPVVPVEDRTERIELVEDLVIGQRGEDQNYILYRPRGVVADSLGRIFVLDGGNNRVQVFDANGEYLLTLGSEGQGPGELAQPMGIALAGDHLVVHDAQSAKFSVWSAGGDHIGDARFTEGRGPSGVVGLASGSLVGRHFIPEPNQQGDDFTLLYELVVFSQEAERTLALQEFPRFEPITVRRAMPNGGVMMMSVGTPSPRVDFAATPDGDIYTTFCAEYQIHAFDESGGELWALRLPWARIPFTQQDIDEIVESLRETIEDIDPSEIEWPQRYPALDGLKVDGHGRLYVFPYYKPEDSDERPVDVYSRDGEHLFSGWIPRMTWDFALGDYVYGPDSDDETGEERIIRYRLVWPE